MSPGLALNSLFFCLSFPSFVIHIPVNVSVQCVFFILVVCHWAKTRIFNVFVLICNNKKCEKKHFVIPNQNKGKCKVRRTLLSSLSYLRECWCHWAQHGQRVCGPGDCPHCRLLECTSPGHLSPQRVHPRPPQCYIHLCSGLLRELARSVELGKKNEERES